MTIHGSQPTWYDVLGVERDASPEEIKAAWRQATDALEPGTGSGRFRSLNDAADVLLDPGRRSAYDETLPPRDGAPEPADGIAGAGEQAGPPAPAPLPESDAAGERARHEPAGRRALLLTGLLALLTVAALVAAGLFALEVRQDAQVAQARDRAPAAAERATEAILAYDYRRLAEDRQRAARYLTDGFEKKYLENFALLEEQEDGTPGAAVQTKTVVKATVLGSGVMDAEADRVRVLVYVNQVSERPKREPQIFQNRVSVEMQREGSRWLVDDLKSY